MRILLRLAAVAVALLSPGPEYRCGRRGRRLGCPRLHQQDTIALPRQHLHNRNGWLHCQRREKGGGETVELSLQSGGGGGRDPYLRLAHRGNRRLEDEIFTSYFVLLE